MYKYKTAQWLPIDLEEAWRFFSSPKNLALITPPELDFKVLSDIEKEDIFEGMKIYYTVKPLLGIAIHWQSEIYRVARLKYFTDRQIKGPYKIWEHTHSFMESNGGVLMVDVVDYNLPFSIIGKFAHRYLIKHKIDDIFNFRRITLENIFHKK